MPGAVARSEDARLNKVLFSALKESQPHVRETRELVITHCDILMG